MNEEIRKAIKKSRIKQYEIAAQIGVSECTFCKWLRTELTSERKERILTAIGQIREGDAND